MKRFWMPVTILLLIISSVGTYYITSAADAMPEFVITSEHGDEEIAKDVTVRGMYRQERYSPSVMIDTEGSDYASDRNLLEMLHPYYYASEEMKQLYKQHRQFMRGKSYEPSFYEDEKVLVYANIELIGNRAWGADAFEFDVAILDKKKDTTIDFTVPFPGSSKYRYPSIWDVQVFGDELVVLMKGFDEKSEISRYSRYVFSIANRELLSEQKIDFPLPETMAANEQVHIQRTATTSVMQPAKFQVFYLENVQVQLTETANSDEISAQNGEPTNEADTEQLTLNKSPVHLMIYNMQSGQFETIDPLVTGALLKGWQEADFTKMILDGETLYSIKQDQQGALVSAYGLTEHSNAEYEVQAEDVIFAEIKGERMYTLSQSERISTATVSVFNFKQEELLYEGKVDVYGTEAYKQEAYEKLEVYGLRIK